MNKRKQTVTIIPEVSFVVISLNIMTYICVNPVNMYVNITCNIDMEIHISWNILCFDYGERVFFSSLTLKPLRLCPLVGHCYQNV